MVDTNEFKRSVKEWIARNPNGTLCEFIDYCEELIPTAQYAANKWLINQSIDWYKHILSSRKVTREQLLEMEQEA